MKRCLKKPIGSGRSTYEELSTVLTEIEAVVNNRPLSYVGDDSIDESITPSHLFCGRRINLTADGEGVKMNPFTDVNITKRAKLMENIVDFFWKRWGKKYLIDLREHHKLKTKQKDMNICENDVVLIHEDGVKRNRWWMGKIKKLIYGKDGVIRGVSVKVPCPQMKGVNFLSRPLQKLYPLEITKRNDDSTNETLDEEETCET